MHQSSLSVLNTLCYKGFFAWQVLEESCFYGRAVYGCSWINLFQWRKEIWKVCEASKPCVKVRFTELSLRLHWVCFSPLHKNLKTNLGNTPPYPPHRDWESHVLRNLLLWRGHLQQGSARSTAEVTLPCSPCPSSVLNETSKVFRMWVISNFFVSKGHCGFGLFFLRKVYYHRIIHRIRGSEAELLSLIRERF